jgi:bifunctional DNA-binding transcriptional regulator/antitoxin component of YhaV-PrlF toxin-antitoxin module
MTEKIMGLGKISTKNQVSIPMDVMQQFKFKIGDKLLFIDDSGKLLLRKA